MTPRRRALSLLLGVVVVAAATAFWPPALPLWIGLVVVTTLVFALDALLCWRLGPFEVERALASSLALGAWAPVSLRVHNRGHRAAYTTLVDHHPAAVQVRGLPFTTRIDGGSSASLVYHIRPEQRGPQRFQPAALRILSPLGLWGRQLRCGQITDTRVYPNFRDVSRYALLATENRTSQLGIRQRPRRGEGMDFHQLREYRTGDTLRQIDWKVTARMHKTISREYQDERDQRIVFLLDCGRKMHALDDSLSHFDHALDAVLLLAHVALRHGDTVGLMTFSGERRWLAPRRGHKQLNAIMAGVYDLKTSNQASDYVSAAKELMARVQRRALVVLVSNLRDEDHEELARAGRALGRSHLVLIASMKERALASALEGPVRDEEDAVRVAATHQYLASRRLAHERLRREGVLVLDSEPHELAVALVNGYLDIKRAGIL